MEHIKVAIRYATAKIADLEARCEALRAEAKNAAKKGYGLVETRANNDLSIAQVELAAYKDMLNRIKEE